MKRAVNAPPRRTARQLLAERPPIDWTDERLCAIGAAVIGAIVGAIIGSW